MIIDKNVEYYNNNADSFFQGSVNADMSGVRNSFLSYIPDGGKILDAGCGSGRDSKAFTDAGYEVVSFDASEEMCKRASEYIGQKVLNMRFEDMEFSDEFDGIWACASLLHVPIEVLSDVMNKMHKALKSSGYIYASFKYGEGIKLRGDRRFCDFSESSVIPVFEDAGFEIVSNIVGTDSRPGREEEKWVNVIGKRCL
ncbi:bifunctional 2-polyprenyl-6-hydroxyphenol methylase/3-demethylubiquinol 3-O-methyltransferase UbiG [Butyrivibrio sp. INlla16]|uniref:class I SAM-dependent methyltransferase n=1 Tax=Butyrivibrio sp. INlla16 TaxID=1520807 RepID=UPI00089180C5|nr:class I SAM-dependent methyltransferase [Butyrivibrio sp. INlla16]SDB53994.1 Methyltransferase domain-containing protein [Butyrivibrio sp. INlla16]